MPPTPPTPQHTFNFLGGKMQEPLPLPAGLEPRAIPDKGYIVEPIADDVYFVTEGSYCTMFVVTSEGVVLVDTPPSFGGNLAAAVAEVTDQPIKYMIYSHSHVDHVGAAGELDPEAVTLVGTPALEDQLVGAGDPRRPVPTKIVPDGGTLAVGGVDIVLKSVKGAHDLGSTIIYLPGRKVLMLVDLVAPGWAPFPCAPSRHAAVPRAACVRSPEQGPAARLHTLGLGAVAHTRMHQHVPHRLGTRASTLPVAT